MLKQMTFVKRRIAILILLIIFFCLQTMLVLSNSITAFESNIYEMIIKLMSPTITNAMTMVSDIGSVTAVTVIIIIMVLLPRTRRTLGFPVLAAVSASVLLNHLLKSIIARPRPDIMWLVDETGYGFPSGHSMNNAALYMVLALIVWRQVKCVRARILITIFLAAMPFFIGISRIYLGVHNVADVLAGWAMGAVCALIADTLWQVYSQDKGHTPL